MEKRKVPEASESNKDIQHNSIASKLFKNIPDTLPGCFGEYESNNHKSLLCNCDFCELRLECARQAAGSE